MMTKKTKETIPVEVAFDEWRKSPEYMLEYDALKKEFALARQFIKARGAAGLTQQELADRMETSRAYIVRLEGGKTMPSTRTLNRFAEATGHRVVINFEPIAAS